MSKKVIKTFFTLVIFALILLAIPTITKATDTTFSLSETQIDVGLNSTRYISYSNKPTRRNSNMDQ